MEKGKGKGKRGRGWLCAIMRNSMSESYKRGTKPELNYNQQEVR